MNIRNLESEIDRTILAKGYDYYENGNILEVSREGKHGYLFQLEGSEVYEVEIDMDESGTIVRSVCDCPYDRGPVCKHEAAAYYELLEMIDDEGNGERVLAQATEQPGLAEILDALSKQQLIEIIVEIAQADKVLKNSLIFKYSQGSDAEELEQCKKLIASIVKKHTGRRGYIEYRGVDNFAREIVEVLERAGESENALLAADIALLVLEEAIEAFQYADDSDGGISWLVDEALDQIRATVEDNVEWEPEMREQLFLKLLQESGNPIFDEWGEYSIALLHMCVQFADVEALRNALIAKIEGFVHANAGVEHRKHANEALLGIWHGILQEYGTAEESEQFVVDHLRYSSFRESLIDKYKQEHNYELVLKLALEGEEQDQDRDRLVLKWRKIRYAVYRELQRKEEQMLLAEQLLFAGEFEYYHELRQLAGEEWAAVYDRLRQSLKQANDWRARDMYVKLIDEAKDLDEMMAYVKANPGAIEKYAGRLAEKFGDEINVIYSDQIRKAANRATNRKSYQSVCGMLRRYGNIAGGVNRAGLIGELRGLYPSKRAFMDELDQI